MARELTANDAELRAVAQGLAYIMGHLPGGRVEKGRLLFDGGSIRLFKDLRFAGTDGRATSGDAPTYAIRAATPCAFVSGLTQLAHRLGHGWGFFGEHIPRFKSRFYKQEVNLGGGSHFHSHIGDLGDDFWRRLCMIMVAKEFNGLVFYPGYHPFEWFLDYKEFPEAPAAAKRFRARTLDGLKRAFGIARSYGLKTFMQHYVTHFPAGLARKHRLGVANDRDATRLAAIDHPIIEEYSRYVYRRTFELLPELTGFYCNFESAANGADFVRRCLYPEAVKARPVPELTFRLWDFNSLPEMVKLVHEYPGKIRLAHKIMDHSDVYYWPTADRRVIDWKKALPNTEFVFILGPCHNSATAQSRRLWSDESFVHRLLADAEAKGADSFSFHTVYELLSPDILAEQLADKHEIHMAALNRNHLDAVVDYVRGMPYDRGTSVKRLGRRLSLSPEAATLVGRSLNETSQISLLTFQQFFCTSSYEGYQTPPRANFYADPFFYPPMTFVNEELDLGMSLYTSWLNTGLRNRSIPGDVRRLIDHVKPVRRPVGRGPCTIAQLIKGHSDAALRLARRAAGRNPSEAMATFLDETRRMYNWGMRVQYEIETGVNIYRAFYSTSREVAVRHLRCAANELKHMLRYMRKDDSLSARRLPLMDEARPEADLALVRRLIRHLGEGDYPYDAYAAFAASLREYNEIRRTVRPYKEIRAEETRTITKQLSASIKLARKAVKALSAPSHATYRANVGKWLGYLETELEGVTPPVYTVTRAASAEDGFVQLFHDQCFRYGENCIADLDAFYTPTDFLRRERMFLRAVSGADGLTLSIREEGVDVAALGKRWKEYAGTASDSFFTRLFVDRKGDGRRTEIFRIHAWGRQLFKEAITVYGRQHTVSELARMVGGGTARFRKGADWWRLDYMIPWGALGGRPAKGETWRVNIATSTAIDRNRQSIWCPGYEMVAGKSARMGTFVFE